jgi:hypothetical protein
MAYMAWEDITCTRSCPWQNYEIMTTNGVHALFNPKLDFYNIVAFMTMNLIDIFYEEEKWLIKISTHAD